jgi:putative acetyltransferase
MDATACAPRPAHGKARAMTYTIRKFHHDDLDAVYAIFVASVREGAARFYDEAQRTAWAPNDVAYPGWRDRLGDAVTYVAEDAGTLVGFFAMTHAGHLDFAYVAPSQMGRGVASALYAAVMADPDLARVQAFDIQASHFSRRFLLKQGWQDAPAETVERFGQQLTVFRMRYLR